MRVAFFGGSFNPPHYSHFLAVAWALCSGEVDEVWMVPCGSHAFGKSLAPFHHRLAMCRLGAQHLGPHVRLLDIESQRSAPSYTIDTIRLLQQKHPTASFRLLVGTDILRETSSWKEFAQLVQLAPLLIIPRQEEHTSPPHPQLPQISSTEIRERIAQQRDLQYFVPPTIERYIQTHQLYQSPPTTPSSPDS